MSTNLYYKPLLLYSKTQNIEPSGSQLIAGKVYPKIQFWVPWIRCQALKIQRAKFNSTLPAFRVGQ